MMNNNYNTRWIALGSLMVGVALGCVATRAQQSGIQRAILFRTDAPPSTTPMEVVMGTAEIPANSNAGKHRHSGIEVGYVLSGAAVMEVVGDAPRTLKAGDAYFIPAEQVHDARVTSVGPAKVLAFYLVEKGKPLALSATQ